MNALLKRRRDALTQNEDGDARANARELILVERLEEKLVYDMACLDHSLHAQQLFLLAASYIVAGLRRLDSASSKDGVEAGSGVV